MKRSKIDPMPQFFDRYINLAEDIDIVDALTKHLHELPDTELLTAAADLRYAEGKWTVKEVWQHIIDNERVQAYRALRFARNDQSTLPGYDQGLFNLHAVANRRTIADLLEEFRAVRLSSIALFESCDDRMLMAEGTCNGVRISVLGLGFVLAGHQVHHERILEERYFPLLA